MNLEHITTAIAAVGAVIAAMFGIYRASGGHIKHEPAKPTDVPSMVDAYLGRLKEIESGILSAVETLRDIRKALEGTGHRQESMVRELEAMNRTMSRVENAQSNSAQVIASMKHHEDVQVQILAQIREEIKSLGDRRFPPHIVRD